LLAQYGEQRRAAVGFDANRPAVDGEINCQFALMPLASMNVDQCLISFSSLARNSEPGANDDSVSTLASRARTFGSAMTVWNAFSILALTGAGMPFGPKMPHQKPKSTSAVLRPSSPIAGTFGSAGERLVLVTAMPLTLPPSISGLPTDIADTTAETCPATTSATAGPPPL